MEHERRAMRLIYYDDLDPAAYETRVCILHADAFSRLWDKCSELNMTVIADAHVHLFGAGQSNSDRENPMIARAGHIAIILPRMARPPIRRWAVGVYEYLGDHQWRARGGCRGSTLRTGVASFQSRLSRRPRDQSKWTPQESSITLYPGRMTKGRQISKGTECWSRPLPLLRIGSSAPITGTARCLTKTHCSTC